MHWNANSINKDTQPIEEFEAFIKKNNIHIISINETKLASTDKIQISNYNIIRKDRNSQGGGVAIFINEQIEYQETDSFDEFNLELISIKVSIKNFQFNFLTFYLPPGAQLPDEKFFDKLSNTNNLILCGDLNCKSKMWYSKKSNPNGNKLAEIITNQDLIIVENKNATHYWKQTNKFDILDLIITSPSMVNKVTNLEIPRNELASDHFPIIFELKNIKVDPIKNKTIQRVNNEVLNKIIEDKCCLFFKNRINEKTNNLNVLNIVLEKIVENAKELATTTFIKKVDNMNLPKYILDLIEKKKQTRKLFKKNKTTSTIVNQITAQVHNEIEKFKQQKLEKECDKLAQMNASDSKFWSLLKKLESNNTNIEQKKIPYLFHNNSKIFNDKEKANLFASIQANIFSPYNDDTFDEEHKAFIEKFVNSDQLFDYDSEQSYNEPFNMMELEEALKQVKPKARGPNLITNKTIKALDTNGKNYLLNLINNSFNNNSILPSWKTAKVTMIPKKPNDRHNPANYRPISLTNTIVKIAEKLIKYRLVYFLENNNIFIKQQSGFRSHRNTTDNIFYFKQKCLEAFGKKHSNATMKVGGILFDIEKAFDKVWHEGLLYKMHQLKVPKKIAIWIRNFISERKFYVDVNGKFSNEHIIQTGVPQGAILSPILFLIFINDIPLTINKYRYDSSSLLFADDLFHFSTNTNLKYLQAKLQQYLHLLEKWLVKWRLKTATNKCTYSIYTEHNTCDNELQLTLFGQQISKENHPKYLGIHLDQNMNLNEHIKQMKEKCLRKLNFIKILKSKKWKTNTKTKINVYNAMIRSNIDFAAPILDSVSQTAKEKIESIQYHSMRHILNKPIGASHTEMREELKFKTLNERIRDLKSKYLSKALKSNQLIQDLHAQHSEFISTHNIKDNKYSMF